MSQNTPGIVGSIPEPNRRRARLGDDYDLDRFARLAQNNPGSAVLALTGVPVTLAATIRTYRNEPFKNDNGQIVVNTRNSTVGEDDVRTGDIYLTWTKNENK